MQNDEKMLRLRELSAKVGLGKSSIYQMMTDGEFPESRKLNKRAVGWLQSEVDTWLLSRTTTRGQK